MLPILPLYAMARGASETTSGLLLAFAFPVSRVRVRNAWIAAEGIQKSGSR